MSVKKSSKLKQKFFQKLHDTFIKVLFDIIPFKAIMLSVLLLLSAAIGGVIYKIEKRYYDIKRNIVFRRSGIYLDQIDFDINGIVFPKGELCDVIIKEPKRNHFIVLIKRNY